MDLRIFPSELKYHIPLDNGGFIGVSFVLSAYNKPIETEEIKNALINTFQLIQEHFNIKD